MDKLTREDLFTLEDYALKRAEFRSKLLAHKRRRQLALGPHVTLYFEDRLTVHYQIQEMLRAERIFEPSAIEEELEAYNPLIPDGENLKATMMLEYENASDRRLALTQLVGVEDTVWISVHGHGRAETFADEDMQRSREEKTSAVHFLRFELGTQAAASLKAGAGLSAGVSHRNYTFSVEAVNNETRACLANDVD